MSSPRLSAGSPSRYQIPIFGGAHGDHAIGDAAGAALGKLLATHSESAVLDLSAFSTAGMRRFMRDFAEALFTHNRAPLTLFIDEADQLAPQTVPADVAKLLHEMERLIRQGRQRGIFVWMLTQRPQVLNKNLLSQAETLIAMKMTTPHDRKAIAEWMEAHDPVLAKEVLATLAQLQVGEGWAWVPAADFLERVQFPLFQTYDSGRTPKHGETVAGVALPALELGELAAALAADDDDPILGLPSEPTWSRRDWENELAHVREQLAAMERDRDRWKASAETRLGQIKKASQYLGYVSLQDLDQRDADQALKRVGPAVRSEPVPGTAGGGPEGDDGRTEGNRPQKRNVPKTETTAGAAPEATTPDNPQVVTAGKTATPSPAARAIAELLDRISPARVTWTQAATMTGRKASGGNFNAARKWLRESGRIVEDGELIRSSAPEPQGLTREEALALWKSVLAQPAPRMLEALWTADGAATNGMLKSRLAERLGVKPTGGNWNNGLSQLRRNHLILVAGDSVFLADPLPGERPR